MADFYTNAAGETGASLPPKAQFTADPDLLKKLAAQRASDAAGYQASVAQGESWATPKPPAPPVPTPATATQTAAQPVNKLAYGAGRAVGVIGNLAGKVAVASPIAGFGDYQANTGGVDTSAGGTIGYLAKGDFSKAGASLGGGAAEALADSGRGVAKTIDGIAGYVGAKPGLTQDYDNMIQNGLGGYLSLRPQTPATTGPISAAAAKANGTAAPGATPNPVDQRTAGVIDEMNKRVGIAPTAQLAGVRGSPTSVAGITKLEGGQFNTPMYTDDPSRAAAEYAAQKGPQQTTTLVGGKPQTTVLDAEGNPQTYFPDLNKGAGGGRQLNSFAAGAGTGPLQAMARGASPQSAGDSLMTVPSTANADRSFLAGAFQRHVNSGDLERARATIDPHDQAQQAQLGAAELAQQRAQAQAYAAAPMETMLKTLLGKSDREKRLEGDITDRAFSGTRRGNVVPKTGDAEQINGLIQMLAANAAKGGNTDPAKAAADALAAMSNSKAAATAQAGAAITQAGQVQMQALQQQLLKETDPTKREQIIENLQTLTGKYEKKGSEAKTKLYPIDVDTGKTDVMGQPIYKKALADETGRIIGGPQAATAAAPTRAQLEADAQSAIGKGANKDAVKQALAAKLKELGL